MIVLFVVVFALSVGNAACIYYRENRTLEIVSVYIVPMLQIGCGLLLLNMYLENLAFECLSGFVLVAFLLGYVILLVSAVSSYIKICKDGTYPRRVECAIGHICQMIVVFTNVHIVIFLYDVTSYVGIRESTYLIDMYVDFLYFSATTFTTLGYGDTFPLTTIAKVACIMQMLLFGVFLSVILSNRTVGNEK